MYVDRYLSAKNTRVTGTFCFYRKTWIYCRLLIKHEIVIVFYMFLLNKIKKINKINPKFAI